MLFRNRSCCWTDWWYLLGSESSDRLVFHHSFIKNISFPILTLAQRTDRSCSFRGLSPSCPSSSRLWRCWDPPISSPRFLWRWLLRGFVWSRAQWVSFLGPEEISGWWLTRNIVGQFCINLVYRNCQIWRGMTRSKNCFSCPEEHGMLYPLRSPIRRKCQAEVAPPEGGRRISKTFCHLNKWEKYLFFEGSRSNRVGFWWERE